MKGGTRATLTDANLLLGLISAETFLGGRMPLSVEAAREAIMRDVAKPLELSVEEAAWAIHVLQVQVRSDRFKSKPWRLFGGEPEAGASATLNPGRATETALPSKFTRRFGRDDVLRFEMAGAGGYGEPDERDVISINEDIRQGKLTPAYARAAYGGSESLS